MHRKAAGPADDSVTGDDSIHGDDSITGDDHITGVYFSSSVTAD